MAYGEKYKYYFYWDHDSANNYYKLSILEDGYASSVTELTAGANPFSYDVKGQKDSINHILYGSECNMEIIVNKSDVDTIDADLLTIDYKDIIVKLIRDPDGSPATEWTGILLPQSVGRDYLGNKFTYSLSAVDGLADLKNKKYTSDGTDEGSAYQGFDDLLTIIKTAISKVADFTELQLDFRIQLGTYSDLMASAENAFKENEIPQEIFYKEKNGEVEADTCYEVLEKILTPFYCVTAQEDGYYWIWCRGERSSYYFEYDWATLTQQSRTSNSRSLTFQGGIGYDLIGRGSLTKIAPINRLTISLYNKEYVQQLITNGTFDANITGWTNGDADDNSNQFTGIGWDDLAGKGGTLEATWAGSASVGNYNFHTSSAPTITVGGGAGTVTVNYSVQYTSETPSGLSSPKVKTRLWNATNGYTASNEGQRSIYTLGSFFVFEDTFTVTGLSVGANYLDFEIEITDASTTQATFNFDDISMRQTSVNDPADWNIAFTPTSGTQYEESEVDFYMSDQRESISDSCALKDTGGSYTSTWDRYGETDTLKFESIFGQYYLNANATYTDYVTCTAYDPGQTINVNNLLYDFALGIAPRYFEIIGITKNYRDATVELQMKESGISVSDVTYNKYSKKLNTQYGETI